MGNSGTEYNVELHYVIRDNQPAISNTGIAPFRGDANSSVDAGTGILCAEATGVLALRDLNSKSSEVDYRVLFTDGTNTVWSDPRIKDVGQ